MVKIFASLKGIKKKQETLNSLFAGLAKYWVESFPGPSRTLRTLFESVEFIHFCQIFTFAVVMGNTGIKVEFFYRSILNLKNLFYHFDFPNIFESLKIN